MHKNSQPQQTAFVFIYFAWVSIKQNVICELTQWKYIMGVGSKKEDKD